MQIGFLPCPQSSQVCIPSTLAPALYHPSNNLKPLLNSLLNRLIKQVGQCWDYGQPKPYGPPGPQPGVSHILHCLPRVTDHRVDCESRKGHGGDCLEDKALGSHGAVVILEADFVWGRSRGRSGGGLKPRRGCYRGMVIVMMLDACWVWWRKTS